MQQAHDPWADFPVVTPSRPSGAATPLLPPAPPSPHPVQTTDEARRDHALANAAEADAALKARELANGTPQQQQQTQARTTRSAAMDALARQIDRVQDLYSTNFANQGIATPLEYLPTPTHQQFNSAAAAIGDQALGLFRVPGVGQQSDRELAAFVAANQPTANDSDLAITEKLNNLRNRINAARQATGLPAWNWRGTPPAPTDEAPNPDHLQTAADIHAAITAAANRPDVPPPDQPYWQRGDGADEEVLHIGDPSAVEPPRGRGPRVDPSLSHVENSIAANIPLIGPGVAAVENTFGAETGNAFLRGARDVPTLGLDDELNATVAAATGGDFDRELGVQRAINAYDTQNHFAARVGGQLVGGLALPYSRGAGLLRMGVEGAAYGGAYGLGSGEGSNRLASGAMGAGIGAGTPLLMTGAGAGLRGAARAFGRPVITDAGRNIARAAAEEGVPISRPIAEAGSRERMSRLEASLGGNGPVRDSLERTATAIDERAGTLADGGLAGEGGAMGQRIQSAALRSHQDAGTRIRRIYDRANAAAGTARVNPSEAVATLDRHIAELAQNENSNAGILGYLRSVRGDLVDADGNLIPKSVGALRDFRTGMRGEISTRNLQLSNAERIMGDVLDAARTDLNRDLTAARRGRCAFSIVPIAHGGSAPKPASRLWKASQAPAITRSAAARSWNGFAAWRPATRLAFVVCGVYWTRRSGLTPPPPSPRAPGENPQRTSFLRLSSRRGREP
jgi:hypothetical protein